MNADCAVGRPLSAEGNEDDAEDQLAGDFLAVTVGQCAIGYRLAEEFGLELGDRRAWHPSD